MDSATSTAKIAAHDSSLGIVVPCFGATLAFPMTNPVCLDPSFDTTLTYDRAAIASSKASEKVWSSTLAACCRDAGTYVLEIIRSLHAFKESFYFSHCSVKSLERISSQSVVSDIKFLNMIFPWIVTGAMKLRGLYKLLIVDNTPLRVKGVSFKEMHESDSRSQYSPRLRCTSKTF